MSAQVYNAPSGSEDGAQMGVAGTALPDNFATDATFLSVKLECDEVRVEDVGIRGGQEVEGLPGELK
jgi:hypothetical protein